MAMVTDIPPVRNALAAPLRAGRPLDAAAYQKIRRTMALEGCKWDPQVGDVETISRFPLILSRSHWRLISELSRSLATELMEAEEELQSRPDLHANLGLPRPLRRVLQSLKTHHAHLLCGRVLRFDFHWTSDGWRISEVNSDVPGGFSEASLLPKLMAPHYAPHTPAGDPGAAWANAITTLVAPLHSACLLAAAGFMEDQQVVAYMERLLAERGLRTFRATPDQLSWTDGIAAVNEPIGVIVRFFQAEWLNVKRNRFLLAGSRTPVMNPGTAILTESKRFPLVWGDLSAKLPTWRRLLPETRDPRNAPWRRDDGWIVKSAFCNTGDTVAIRSLLTARQWSQVKREIWLHPRNWIAQRRFAIEPVATESGPIFPCIGVYTVVGEPAGIYGRYSHSPVVNYAAVDAAVLIDDEREFI